MRSSMHLAQQLPQLPALSAEQRGRRPHVGAFGGDRGVQAGVQQHQGVATRDGHGPWESNETAASRAAVHSHSVPDQLTPVKARDGANLRAKQQTRSMR